MTRRWSVAVLAALALALLLPGCGKDRTGHPTERKPRVELTTEISEADLGVALYPNGHTAFDAGRENTRTGSAFLSTTQDSNDSVEKVYAWYREKLGRPLQTDVLITDGRGAEATLVKQDGADSIEISIFGVSGKTRTVIARRRAPDAEQPKPTTEEPTDEPN